MESVLHGVIAKNKKNKKENRHILMVTRSGNVQKGREHKYTE